MHLNIVDQYDVFELSDKLDITNIVLPNGVNVIAINNFYKYPEKVAALAYQIPLPKVLQSVNTLKNGYKAESAFIVPKDTVYKVVHDAIRAHSEDGCVSASTLFTYDKCTARFNIYDTSSACVPVNFPHVDPFGYACLLPLDKCEGYGGTALLRHTATGVTTIPAGHEAEYKDVMSQFKLQEAQSSSIKHFDILHHFKSVYNRMIIFDASLIHSSMIDFSAIRSSCGTRVLQVMFINKKEV